MNLEYIQEKIDKIDEKVNHHSSIVKVVTILGIVFGLSGAFGLYFLNSLSTKLADTSSKLDDLSNSEDYFSGLREKEQNIFLDFVSDQKSNFTENMNLSRQERVDIISSSICGALNAQSSMELGHWDSGTPHHITEVDSCSNFCKTKEDTHACSGLVMISANLTTVAGKSCDYSPHKKYFSDKNNHLFCCCR